MCIRDSSRWIVGMNWWKWACPWYPCVNWTDIAGPFAAQIVQWDSITKNDGYRSNYIHLLGYSIQCQFIQKSTLILNLFQRFQDLFKNLMIILVGKWTTTIFLFSSFSALVKHKSGIKPRCLQARGCALTDLLNKEVVNKIGSNPKDDRWLPITVLSV